MIRTNTPNPDNSVAYGLSPVASSSSPSESDSYLPARMVNEYVYCPRLFYLEYVENQFAHNQETVEGPLATAESMKNRMNCRQPRSWSTASSPLDPAA